MPRVLKELQGQTDHKVLPVLKVIQDQVTPVFKVLRVPQAWYPVLKALKEFKDHRAHQEFKVLKALKEHRLSVYKATLDIKDIKDMPELKVFKEAQVDQEDPHWS